MGDREIAVATIKAEHRSLSTVLHTFQELLSKVATGHGAPEFELYSAMLYYIDDFQERCHHPKEDEYFFKVLGAATSEFDSVISELQAQHVSGVHALSRLYRCLVHYQGGAAGGLEALLFGHMRCEDDLLERSLSLISEQGWAQMAAAFDSNDDPLFGNNRRAEFARLYQRIQRLAPRKLKQGYDWASSEARTA
jgi:hemerythrin-like domain-containing protein